MRIERVTESDERLVAALARLVPQLSPHRTPPGLLELAEMAAAPGTSLLIAFEDDDVLGMLTLVLYRVHNKLGEPCPRCGTPIARVDFEEHTIFYCPKEQTGGRTLKDRRLSRLLK